MRVCKVIAIAGDCTLHTDSSMTDESLIPGMVASSVGWGFPRISIPQLRSTNPSERSPTCDYPEMTEYPLIAASDSSA
jgi:hypothetical protein